MQPAAERVFLWAFSMDIAGVDSIMAKVAVGLMVASAAWLGNNAYESVGRWNNAARHAEESAKILGKIEEDARLTREAVIEMRPTINNIAEDVSKNNDRIERLLER